MKLNLPQVYSDSYTLTLNLLSRTKGFPKHYRPTLARRIEERCLDLAMNVRKMALTSQNSRQNKINFVNEASHATDDLKFLMQVCRDLNLLSAGNFGVISEKVSDIGTQIGALNRKMGP